MAAGRNGSWDGTPLLGLEKVAEHVHVGALAGHQLAQDSNLLQATAVCGCFESNMAPAEWKVMARSNP